EGIGISQNGRIVDVNDQFLRMFGCGRAEMIGRDVLDLVAPESRSIVAESIRLGREEIFEHRLLRHDGSFFYAEARAKTVRVGDQNLRMAALRDITERKRPNKRCGKARNGTGHSWNSCLMPSLCLWTTAWFM